MRNKYFSERVLFVLCVFLDEFVALVFHFSSANSQQNRGMIWHRSGVIEDEGQLIDKILN